MKKLVLYAVVLVLISAVAIPSVLAATNNHKMLPESFKSMFGQHRSPRRSQPYHTLDKGEIIQEETYRGHEHFGNMQKFHEGDADRWDEHFDSMQKFHEENGFGHGMMRNSRNCIDNDYRGNMMRGYSRSR